MKAALAVRRRLWQYNCGFGTWLMERFTEYSVTFFVIGEDAYTVFNTRHKLAAARFCSMCAAEGNEHAVRIKMESDGEELCTMKGRITEDIDKLPPMTNEDFLFLCLHDYNDREYHEDEVWMQADLPTPEELARVDVVVGYDPLTHVFAHNETGDCELLFSNSAMWCLAFDHDPCIFDT
eukprot:gene10928-17042_t